MSTILVNTLTGTGTAGSIAVTGEGNSTTTNLQQGLCKGWVNFVGTGTVSISDSFNTASLTDVATGKFDKNYTNNMSSANYAGHVCSDAASSNDGFNRIASGTIATTKVELRHYEANSLTDTLLMVGSVDGDLA
tara:strand:+ start:589 stop:990 length:402 start_codon:yes stop_codon:yes gene_type:complete